MTYAYLLDFANSNWYLIDKEVNDGEEANSRSSSVIDHDISGLPFAMRDFSMPLRRRNEVLEAHIDHVVRLFVFVDDKECIFETARHLMTRGLL